MDRYQTIYNIVKPHIKNNLGAEIGVWKGQVSKMLFNKFPSLKLILVDPYKVYDHYKKYHGMEKYVDQIEFSALAESLKYDLIRKYGNRVIWYQKFSLDAAPLVEDGFLDFCYLDANYGYKYVKEDISAWFPKVRRGGVIFGHIIDSNKD